MQGTLRSITRSVNKRKLRKWRRRLFPKTHPLRLHFFKQSLWWYRLKIKRENPIIIYQSGKVGSRSLQHSLSRDYFVLHTHSLDIDWAANLLPAPRQVRQRGYVNWLWIRHNVIEPNRQFKVISLVRDPIAIVIAGFFDRLHLYMETPKAHLHFSLEEILEKFYEVQEHGLDYVLSWFDNEFKIHLDFDIYAHDFDKEAGYMSVHNGSHEILVLKLEMDDRKKSTHVANFLHIDQFGLASSNIAAKKPYADVYDKFKKQVVISEEILNRAYGSQYANHFYTPEEIRKFQAKWEHMPEKSLQNHSNSNSE